MAIVSNRPSAIATINSINEKPCALTWRVSVRAEGVVMCLLIVAKVYRPLTVTNVVNSTLRSFH